MKKHTHRGTCQVCCKLHAVNNETGKLADHGYTLPPHWHMRNGSCVGAVELPYEKSRDVIPRFIKMLNDSAAHFEKAAAKARRLELDEIKTSRMNWHIAKLLDGGYEWRRYSQPDAWAAKSGQKPVLVKSETPIEHCAAWGDEATEITARQFAQGCEDVAYSFDYRVKQCRQDAVQWKKRYDEWVPNAALVPVDKERAVALFPRKGGRRSRLGFLK